MVAFNIICRVFVPGNLKQVFTSSYQRCLLLRSYSADNTGTQYLPGCEDIPEFKQCPEDVKKLFSLEFASKKEYYKMLKADAVKKFQARPGDYGSAPVQVGILTTRIKYLTDHMRNNKKDKSCLHHLVNLIHRRRNKLQYLRRVDFVAYHTALKELGLKPLQDDKYSHFKRRKK